MKKSLVISLILLMPLFIYGNLDLYKSLFPDLTEKVCLIMKDEKSIFRFSSNDKVVHLNTEEAKEDIKKHGFEIKDIKVIIHNHFYRCKFTRSDKKQYWGFKQCGFDGQFLLYCHRTNKVYDIKNILEDSPKEESGSCDNQI